MNSSTHAFDFFPRHCLNCGCMSEKCKTTGNERSSYKKVLEKGN